MIKRPSPINIIKGIIEVEESIGGFIANGPDDGIGGYVRNEYRKRCDQFANLPGWARALANAPAGSLGRVCQPYFDASGFDGPQISPPPFTGGQCPGVTYIVSAAGTNAQGSAVTANRIGTGPVGGMCFGPENQFGNTPVGVSFSNGCVFAGGGAGNTTPGLQGTWSVTSVTRQDGQADNCGDPEGELEPGPNPPADPGPTDGPEPTADPDDPTGVPLLPIPPYQDPIGGPVPIEAEPEGESGVQPEDIPGNTESQPGGGENIGDAIAGGGSPGGNGDDIEFPEPPPGRAWVGALFQFDVPSAYGNIPNSGPANLVTPRVFANCSLTYENGRGTAHRVNSGNIDLFRPSGALKVTGVYVNSSPGITFNVRPVSLELCPENNCTLEE